MNKRAFKNRSKSRIIEIVDQKERTTRSVTTIRGHLGIVAEVRLRSKEKTKAVVIIMLKRIALLVVKIIDALLITSLLDVDPPCGKSHQYVVVHRPGRLLGAHLQGGLHPDDLQLGGIIIEFHPDGDLRCVAHL